MELPSRVVAILILSGMIFGIFFDISQEKKKKKKKRAAAAKSKLTQGQKAAKLIEQYIDGAMGDA